MLERRHRIKLLASAVTLAVVIVFAAIAQRTHRMSASAAFVPQRTPAATGERSRATFGAPPVVVEPAERTRVQEPSRVQPSSPTESAEPTEPVKDARAAKNVPGSVVGFLERWRSSLANGDIGTHVKAYAPRVKRYFRQRNVSGDAVRNEKERLLRIYPNVNKYDISDIRLESLKGDRAVVTLRKDWDTSGVRRFAGSEKQRLTLHRSGGEWQIVGEEEVKVYWVRR